MRRNLIGLCALLFCVCSGSRESVAQSVSFMVDMDRENFGLRISSPTATVATPERIVGLKCTLTNDTPKQIVSYRIEWIATSASGGKVTTGHANRASLRPGDSIDIDTKGGLTMGSTPDDPIVSVRVGVGYVRFGDGSEGGEELSKKLQKYQCADLRRQLLHLYQERGLEALLQELSN